MRQETLTVDSVLDLPSKNTYIAKRILVENVGIFEHRVNGSVPNGTTIFPCNSGGTWNKVLSDGTGAGTGNYAAPKWTEEDGDLIAGQNTFSDVSLVGASDMNFIIVNNVVEFVDSDYTFDTVSGEITRVNQWQVGDVLITPHKAA